MILLFLMSSFVIGIAIAMLFECLYETGQSEFLLATPKSRLAIGWWCLIVLITYLSCPWSFTLHMPGILLVALSHIDLSGRRSERLGVMQIAKNIVSASSNLFSELLGGECNGNQ